MGAHLAGLIGRTVDRNAGQKLGRVTGLDPAEPYFDSAPLESRIQANDADLVDIIHTSLWYNVQEPLGQIDFYPNGGGLFNQPGCWWSFFDFQCNHFRAVDYFIESFGNAGNAFSSLECDSWQTFENGACDGNLQVPMGEGLKKSSIENGGLFFLSTNSASPFSQS